MMRGGGKKLLVLDVNGLLIDSYFDGEPRPSETPDAKVNRRHVYKRPFCEEFLSFCLENFVVGVWSSARSHNVNAIIEAIFQGAAGKLAFCWNQLDCTMTKHRHPENRHKPVFFKELKLLWDKMKPELPWDAGDFGPKNTLLIDDSPYKAVKNPPHTAIFPRPYKAVDLSDAFLVSDLKEYLLGVLAVSDVQRYVKENPIGEPNISYENPIWSFLKDDVLGLMVEASEETAEDAGAHADGYNPCTSIKVGHEGQGLSSTYTTGYIQEIAFDILVKSRTKNNAADHMDEREYALGENKGADNTATGHSNRFDHGTADACHVEDKRYNTRRSVRQQSQKAVCQSLGPSFAQHECSQEVSPGRSTRRLPSTKQRGHQGHVYRPVMQSPNHDWHQPERFTKGIPRNHFPRVSGRCSSGDMSTHDIRIEQPAISSRDVSMSHSWDRRFTRSSRDPSMSYSCHEQPENIPGSTTFSGPTCRKFDSLGPQTLTASDSRWNSNMRDTYFSGGSHGKFEQPPDLGIGSRTSRQSSMIRSEDHKSWSSGFTDSGQGERYPGDISHGWYEEPVHSFRRSPSLTGTNMRNSHGHRPYNLRSTKFEQNNNIALRDNDVSHGWDEQPSDFVSRSQTCSRSSVRQSYRSTNRTSNDYRQSSNMIQRYAAPKRGPENLRSNNNRQLIETGGYEGTGSWHRNERGRPRV